MIVHSIKWRLQVWDGLLLASLVAGLMAGFYTFEKRARLQAVDSELQAVLLPLMPQILPPPGPRGGGPPPFDDGPRPGEDWREDRPIGLGKCYYAAWSEEGRRIALSANAPADLPMPPNDDVAANITLRTRGTFRELGHMNAGGTRIVIGVSIAPMLAELGHLALLLALIGFAIVIAGFSIGWVLVTRALRPIAEISGAAQEIAAGDLTKRIDCAETESELGNLTMVLNSTFARLESAFAQQARFTADAAHELRTPVSVILTQVQSALARERTPAEYRDTLEACQRASQRMRRLIESLLALARLDAGSESIQRDECDLSKVVGEVVEWVRPLATGRSIAIHAELADAPCRGDAQSLAQVAANLLTNAIEYNHAAGEVRVATKLVDGAATLTVRNTGPGISAEDLPHIFERFHRGDKSRTGDHSGLGLAITHSIVKAHGGSIEAASDARDGTTFTVKLPA